MVGAERCCVLGCSMMSTRRKGKEQKMDEENKTRRQIEVESQPEAELATLGEEKAFITNVEVGKRHTDSLQQIFLQLENEKQHE